MRNIRLPVAGLLLILSCGSAAAQATVDPRALDTLKPTTAPKPAPENGRPRPPAKPVAKPAPTRTAPAKPAPTKPGAAKADPTRSGVPAPPPAPPPQPQVPAAAPPVPVIPPPVPVPVRPPPPPTPVPITSDAPGEAIPIPDGLRVTFGSQRADVNQAMVDAIRALGTAAAPNATFNLTAYAAGMPEDPSTPRRLALARALAARSLLIAQGLPSTRIYVKALGATAPGIADGPPDRLDIVVTTPKPAAPQAAPQAAPPVSVSAPPAKPAP